MARSSKRGWCDDDQILSIELGWYVGHTNSTYQNRIHWISPVPKVSADEGWGRYVFTDTEGAFSHVLELALCGDLLCYKALRIVVKTNETYQDYKPTVRAIYKQYWR